MTRDLLVCTWTLIPIREARCLFRETQMRDEISFQRNRFGRIHRRILASHCIPICWIRRNIKRGTRSSCPVDRQCRLTGTPGNSMGPYLGVPSSPSFLMRVVQQPRGDVGSEHVSMCMCIYMCVCSNLSVT